MTFEVRVTNRGEAVDTLTVSGTRTSKAFKVTYTSGGKNVTPAVVDGSFRTSTLRSGASTSLTVRVTRSRAATKGTAQTVKVHAASAHAPGKDDLVSARTRVKG